MDVERIRPGFDFRDQIKASLDECDAFLCIIGPNWTDSRNEAGKRRLEDPADFVRIETAAALKRKIQVIPVLVHGAQMPSAEALPEELQSLVYRNAVELRHTRWRSDTQFLIDELRRSLNEAESHPTSSVVPPADGHPIEAAPLPGHIESSAISSRSQDEPAHRITTTGNRKLMVLALPLVAVALIGYVGYHSIAGTKVSPTDVSSGLTSSTVARDSNGTASGEPPASGEPKNSPSMPTSTQPTPKSDVVVQYYRKNADNPEIRAAIVKLGFAVEERPALISDMSVNDVVFGANVSPEDAKSVAAALVRAGVQIKGIHTSRMESKANLIQVIANRLIDSKSPISEEQIRQMSSFSPDPS